MTESEQLAAAQARIAELEGANQRAAKSAAINAALAGHDFASPAAAEQVAALVEPEIEIVNGVAVDKTMRPVRDAIAERLKQPGYAHFLKGKGAYQPQTTAAPAPNPDLEPVIRPGETFSDAIIRRNTAQRMGGGTDPRLNPALSFGLRRQGA
jgi:hypothetical protein